MVIQYCDTCGMRVSDDDLQSGTALQGEENKVWCARCAPAQFVQTDTRKGRSSKILAAVPRASERRIKPVSSDANKIITPGAPTPGNITAVATPSAQGRTTTTTATHPSSGRTSSQTTPPKTNTIAIAAVLTAIVLIGGLMLAASGPSPKPLDPQKNKPETTAKQEFDKPGPSNDNTLASNGRTLPGPRSLDMPPPSTPAQPSEKVEKPPLPAPPSPEVVKNMDNEFTDMRNGIAAKRLEELKAFMQANADDFWGIKEKASDLLVTYRSTPAGEEALKLIAALKSPAGSATFVRTDTTTSGNWKGVYGKDATVFPTDTAKKLPAGSRLAVNTSARSTTWKAPSDDPRALMKVTDSTRVASCWANPSIYFDLQVPEDKGARLTLYFMDFDKQKRSMTIEMVDAADVILDKRDLLDCIVGTYVTYDIKGSVRVRITRRGGSNAVMSGFFFDPFGTDLPVGVAGANAPATPSTVPDKTASNPATPPNTPAPQTAEAAKAAEDALNEYERVVAAAYASLKSGETQAAVNALEKAKADPVLASMQAKLAIDLELTQGMEDINKAALAMLPGLADKGVTLEKIDGEKVQIGGSSKCKILEIKGRTIQTEQNVGGGKVIVGIEFDSFSLPTRLELAGSAVPEIKSVYGWFVAMHTGASNLSLKAMRQKLDAARKADAPAAQADHLASRIAMFEKEQSAEPAFRALDPLLKDKKWAEAETFLENYQKEYAGTRAMQRLKPVIEQKWAELEALLHPPKPGLWTSFWSVEQKAPNAAKTMIKARVETVTTFNWGTNAPDPAVPADYFGVKQAGILRIEKEGTYSFKVIADDKVTLTLDGKDAVYTPGASKEKSVDIPMTKGDHAIKIWYIEITGAASYTVFWKPPGAKAFTHFGSALLYDERNIEKYQKE